MIREDNSTELAMKISLLTSAIIFSALWFSRQVTLVRAILFGSIIIFILFCIYFAVAQFLPRLGRAISLSAIANAVIVYFGFLMMSLSLFKDLLSKVSFDLSMAGLGIAVVAFGIVLSTQHKSSQSKEAATELRSNLSDLMRKVAILNRRFIKLEKVLDTVLEESQKSAGTLNKLQEENKSRRSQMK